MVPGLSYVLSKLFGEIWRPLRRKVLNAFGIKTHGQKMEDELEKVNEKLQRNRIQKERLEEERTRVDEKEDKIAEIESEISEKRNRISRFERIMQSLEREGITRREVIKKYERPLPVVLVAYTKQESPLGTGNKFVRQALSEKFDMQWYGGHDAVIPPRKVKRAGIEGLEDIERLMEEEVFEGQEDRYAVIKHATVVDLAGEVYWKNNIPYDTEAETVAEALDMEEILESEEFLDLISAEDRDALERVIREGDIGFFASRWVEESDLDNIHEHQTEIERQIGEDLPDLNLSNLASEQSQDVLVDVVGDYVNLPEEELEELAENIQTHAQIWKEELT